MLSLRDQHVNQHPDDSADMGAKLVALSVGGAYSVCPITSSCMRKRVDSSFLLGHQDAVGEVYRPQRVARLSSLGGIRDIRTLKSLSGNSA